MWSIIKFFCYQPDEVDFTKTKFNIKQSLNDNWDKVKSLFEEVRAEVDSKQKKPVVSQTTISYTSWSEGTVSFESDFPSATYDIAIELDGSRATPDQVLAWNRADIKGGFGANKIYAKGKVPKVNLPIIRTVITK